MSWEIYIALFLTGLAAGFVDAIAGGGGLLTVPMLLWAGLSPQMTLGTNKFQSACGTALAVWRYSKAGLIGWRQAGGVVAVSFVASVGGALAVSQLDASWLKRVMPWLLLAVGVYALASPNLGEKQSHRRLGLVAFSIIFGILLGFYDGFFGPGTGSFWTLAFVTLCGLELRQATAHTKAVNLASNVGSLFVFLPMGTVHYGCGVAMIGGQLIGAYLGSHMVITRGARFIRLLFLAVVFAVTIKLLWTQAQH